MQFFDIIDRNFLDLSKERVDKLKGHLFECMKNLLRAEEYKNLYVSLEEQSINRIYSPGGINIQNNSYSFDDPTEKLKKHFEDFLIRCVISIRKITKIADIISSKSFKSIKDVKKHLKSVFGDTSYEWKMIEEDSLWVKELYDFRGAAEHDELITERFDVNYSSNGTPIIKVMILPQKDVSVREYILVTLENCLGFIEDMIAILLNTKLSNMVHIVQVPEDFRHKYRGFKYTLNLKGEYKEKLNEAIKQNE